MATEPQFDRGVHPFSGGVEPSVNDNPLRRKYRLSTDGFNGRLDIFLLVRTGVMMTYLGFIGNLYSDLIRSIIYLRHPARHRSALSMNEYYPGRLFTLIQNIYSASLHAAISRNEYKASDRKHVRPCSTGCLCTDEYPAAAACVYAKPHGKPAYPRVLEPVLPGAHCRNE